MSATQPSGLGLTSSTVTRSRNLVSVESVVKARSRASCRQASRPEFSSPWTEQVNITTESWLAAAWLAGAGDPTATSWIGRFCNERPTVVTRTRSLAPSSWRRKRTDSGCVVQVAPLAVSNGVFNWSGAAASVTLSPAPFGGSASARLPDSSAIDATSPAAATAAIIPSSHPQSSRLKAAQPPRRSSCGGRVVPRLWGQANCVQAELSTSEKVTGQWAGAEGRSGRSAGV